MFPYIKTITTQTKMVREIFQRKSGKDFYRDQLEYLEYDPDDFGIPDDYYEPEENDVIAYKLAKKLNSSE